MEVCIKPPEHIFKLYQKVLNKTFKEIIDTEKFQYGFMLIKDAVNKISRLY